MCMYQMYGYDSRYEYDGKNFYVCSEPIFFESMMSRFSCEEFSDFIQKIGFYDPEFEDDMDMREYIINMPIDDMSTCLTEFYKDDYKECVVIANEHIEDFVEAVDKCLSKFDEKPIEDWIEFKKKFDGTEQHACF